MGFDFSKIGFFLPSQFYPGPVIESIVDNLVRDTVRIPAVGSVVYCGLANCMVEHSGIYVGADKIVHLDGSGRVETVTPAQFLARLDGFNLAMSIYVSCKDGRPVGSAKAASRALAMVGKTRNYNLLMDNCHQFSAGCVTGDFENSANFLCLLKSCVKDVLAGNEGRVWQR